MEEKKRDLRIAAMKGEWRKVSEIYSKERELRKAKITGTGDTVLHMAVSGGKEHLVEKMVDIVCSDPYQNDMEADGHGYVYNVLGAENEGKNTPLHIAASMGNVEMCNQFVSKERSLVSKRNSDGETPLFLAAFHGKRRAFLWLHYNSNNSTQEPLKYHEKYCVRENGDNILHCAIAGGHFDVAIEIVLLYKHFLKDMMSVNHVGLSPLHLLAATPTAFRSCTPLGRPFGHLAYHCLNVKDKTEATKYSELEKESHFKSLSSDLDDVKENNRTVDKSINFVMRMLRNLLEISELVGGNIYGLNGVRGKKEKHVWCRQIMNLLLQNASDSLMSTVGPIPEKPSPSFSTEDVQDDKGSLKDSKKIIETPLMIAARNGVIEMVERIVEEFPSTIKDVNDEGKNIVLIAAENKQTKIYNYLCKHRILIEGLFGQVDNEGNSACHLAAKLGDERTSEFSGEALRLQWEVKWFKYVKDSVSCGVFPLYNNELQTPDDIFNQSHQKLVESGEDWLNKTSQACSVVSTLVMTVAFAVCTNVPDSFNGERLPKLIEKPVFQFFAFSSLVALIFSLISTILFLSIAITRSQAFDYFIDIPFRLFLSMSAMFTSILFMWITFCVGHSFLIIKQFQIYYVRLYVVISIPVTLYAISKFPVYWNLLAYSFKRDPAPSHYTSPAIKCKKPDKQENSKDHTSEGTCTSSYPHNSKSSTINIE